MKVSVVIPTYNRAHWLAECVESVAAQTHTDLEIIVVDDCSTDETPSVAADLMGREPRMTFLRQETNQGGQAARNRGLKAATGEFVNFLDSDDLFHSDKLRRQLSWLEENPKADFAVCQMAHFSETPADAKTLWNTFAGDDPLVRFLRHDPVWGIHAPLWRRSCFETLGPFDPKLPLAQDYEFHARALCLGLKPILKPELLCYCRLHEGPSIGKSKQALRYRVLSELFLKFDALLRKSGLWTEAYAHELALDCLWLSTLTALLGDRGLTRGCIANFAMLEPSTAVRRKALRARPLISLLLTFRKDRFFQLLRKFYRTNVGSFDDREGWFDSHLTKDEPDLLEPALKAN